MIRVEEIVGDEVKATWLTDAKAPVKWTDKRGLVLKDGVDPHAKIKVETDTVIIDGKIYSS